MLASASPRNPYVPIDVRSSKSFNFDVVNRSQRIGRSSRYDTSASTGGERRPVGSR